MDVAYVGDVALSRRVGALLSFGKVVDSKPGRLAAHLDKNLPSHPDSLPRDPSRGGAGSGQQDCWCPKEILSSLAFGVAGIGPKACYASGFSMRAYYVSRLL